MEPKGPGRGRWPENAILWVKQVWDRIALWFFLLRDCASVDSIMDSFTGAENTLWLFSVWEEAFQTLRKMTPVAISDPNDATEDCAGWRSEFI